MRWNWATLKMRLIILCNIKNNIGRFMLDDNCDNSLLVSSSQKKIVCVDA